MVEKDKVVLIIGVDKYTEKKMLDNLPACKKDAEDIFNLFKKELKYTIFEDRPLIGSQLDKKYGFDEIKTAITEFFKKGKPNQTLIFYFSGHGIAWNNDVYLGTPQIDPKSPLSRGFALSSLSKVMEVCKSKRIVSIIDACHAGAANLSNTKVINKKAAKDEANLALATFDRLYKNVPLAEGRYLMLSSQSYAPSWATKTNSVYTKYLISGFKGVKKFKDKDGEHPGSIDTNGNVTPEALHDYVYDRVASKYDQVPKLKGDRASKIVLANYPVLPEKQNESKTQITKEIDLSKWITIRDQGPDAGGLAYTAAYAMEIALAQQNKSVLLSGRYIYEKSKRHDELGIDSEGTWSPTIAYVIQQFGAPLEKDWPYNPEKRDIPKGMTWAKLDREAKKYAVHVSSFSSFNEISTHLSAGRAVVASIEIHDPGITNITKKSPIYKVKKGSRLEGVTLTTIVGYSSKTDLYKCAHTWGKEWADGGFFYMSLDTLKKVCSVPSFFTVQV